MSYLKEELSYDSSLIDVNIVNMYLLYRTNFIL